MAQIIGLMNDLIEVGSNMYDTIGWWEREGEID